MECIVSLVHKTSKTVQTTEAKYFSNNLSKNYFAQGRTTVETIAPKYCEGNTWAGKINYFVNKILLVV